MDHAPAEDPVPAGPPPRWAATTGLDNYGQYADLMVHGAVQRLRWCPPGRFFMGAPPREPGRRPAEGPAHAVTLSAGFWLADSPVTEALWAAMTGADPSTPNDPAEPDRPATLLSWSAALAFCALLEEHLQRAELRVAGQVFRLPTEAEWEYGCRAGSPAGTLDRSGQNDPPALDRIAWYAGNRGRGEAQAAPRTPSARRVKQKAPNAWGLFDTLGNVWEWCADTVEAGAGYPGGPRVDPLGQSGPHRAARGGSWLCRASHLRPASRQAYDPAARAINLGFRLCFAAPLPSIGPAGAPSA